MNELLNSQEQLVLLQYKHILMERQLNIKLELSCTGGSLSFFLPQYLL